MAIPQAKGVGNDTQADQDDCCTVPITSTLSEWTTQGRELQLAGMND